MSVSKRFNSANIQLGSPLISFGSTNVHHLNAKHKTNSLIHVDLKFGAAFLSSFFSKTQWNIAFDSFKDEQRLVMRTYNQKITSDDFVEVCVREERVCCLLRLWFSIKALPAGPFQ